jgi:hypothetical protein
MKMTTNGKTLIYKVVYLVESYNFHIKFTFIRVQTKNYKILKTDWTPIAVAHGGSRCYSTARVRNTMGHSGRSLPLSLTALDVSLRPKKNDVLGFKFCKKKNDVLLNLAVCMCM